jgi:hypothetical protein
MPSGNRTARFGGDRALSTSPGCRNRHRAGATNLDPPPSPQREFFPTYRTSAKNANGTFPIRVGCQG